ncbi:hypothetical protein [Phenylobacterium sp.]|jgi:hypothetical protein
MAHTADMHRAHATRSRRWSPLETLSFVTACSALLWLAIIQLAQAA